MTESDAAAWGEKNGCDMEKVPLSGSKHFRGPRGYRGGVSPAPGKERSDE